MARSKIAPKYIAVDSDVLREISFLYLLRKEYGYSIDPEKLPLNSSLKKDFNYYTRFLNCIEHDELRIVILDAVYQESKHSESLVNFIKEVCYFPNINAANYQEKAEKARKLARAYCSEYVLDGKTMPAPMKSLFIADINKYVPSNDCYIMAQATIEGLPLLTGNGKDFIFNKRNSNRENHDRVKGIAQINISNGYYSINAKGNKSTSAPILMYELGPMLKKINAFNVPEQADDFIEANNLL